MAEFDMFKSALDAGMAFTQMTRDRAEAIVRDLTRAGEDSREQMTTQVEDLIERSRKNTEALVGMVRHEIDDRLAGLATRDDLAKLAARFGIVFPSGAGAAQHAPPRRTAARTSAAKKTTVGKTAAKKTTASKTAATKAVPVKKAVPAKKAVKRAASVKKAAKRA
jgi:polyhydroxyalkanoate synthesis regulator phasin